MMNLQVYFLIRESVFENALLHCKISDLVSDIPAGDGKIANLFYSEGISSPPQYLLTVNTFQTADKKFSV
jgi:hypothetical protein